jgi:glycogen operon protein
MNEWRASEGSSYPLGATWIAADKAYNFAVYSRSASTLSLRLFTAEDLVNPVFSMGFDPMINKTDDIWHCRVPEAQAGSARYYSLRATSAPERTGEGILFHTDKELLDPYAKAIYFPPTFDFAHASKPGDNAGLAALAVLPAKEHVPFDWEGVQQPLRGGDLTIYEMHVRGFTQNPNSGVAPERRGRFLGVIDKIPYLQELGVTAVELMPIFCFEPHGENYWGYMPIGFFCPHPTYGSSPEVAEDEFRQMVKALHKAGIEVLLDVVFNHTAEEDHKGPTYGKKALDNTSYYLTTGAPPSAYTNLSGTGNTFDTASRPVRRFVLDSLRHWVRENHVDGFRFDLASVFARNEDGTLNTADPPIFAEIAADHELEDTRLIAEPWDAADGYLLGRSFPGLNWMQWNGRFRDDIKHFVRGDDGYVTNMLTRVYGSDDLFPGDPHNARHPYQSINYVVSHDGFSLYDTCAYEEKRNWANGSNNTDGPSDNISCNYGVEGDEGATPEILRLRRRQVKNFFALLMVSAGTPMFRMGDEFLQTQGGNSNPWNQDNETSWLDWDRLEQNRDIFRFVSKLIAFRNSHPSICRSRFWRDDVSWYGTAGACDFSNSSHTFAYLLRGASQKDTDLYVMVNMYWEDLRFVVQAPGNWKCVVDTSLDSPADIVDEAAAPAMPLERMVGARSVVVAVRG